MTDGAVEFLDLYKAYPFTNGRDEEKQLCNLIKVQTVHFGYFRFQTFSFIKIGEVSYSKMYKLFVLICTGNPAATMTSLYFMNFVL